MADETWGAKCKVMSENVLHHIEEEESDMFKKARKAFRSSELHDLGERMATRKQEALGRQRGNGSSPH